MAKYFTIPKFFRQQVQHSTDILLPPGSTTSPSYTGNPYPSYSEQVKESSRKYNGIATWGIQPTRAIVDVRSVFIAGGGIQPVHRDGKTAKESPELQYIKDFLDWNQIHQGNLLKWVKEGEIEGKFLCRLVTNPENKTVDVRVVGWEQSGYTVKTKPDDYAEYESVTYRYKTTDSGATEEVTLSPDKFVFRPLGGRTCNVNTTPTRIGSCLRQVESLDKALRDWREINHLFASPTPVVKCADSQGAREAHAFMAEINWKIGKLLTLGNAEFTLVSASTDGVDSVKGEIVMNAQQISAATGIPVQFLGFPDLMSNRSTAENLMELVFASTADDRQAWHGIMNELFEKVLTIAKETQQKGFDPKCVRAEFPELSASQLQMIKELWLPLYDSGVIDKQEILERLPNVDVEKVLERMEAQEEKDAEAAAAAGPLSDLFSQKAKAKLDANGKPIPVKKSA